VARDCLAARGRRRNALQNRSYSVPKFGKGISEHIVRIVWAGCEGGGCLPSHCGSPFALQILVRQS
jgi:hypothetical protein